MPADPDTVPRLNASPAANDVGNPRGERRGDFSLDDCELALARTAERYRSCGRLAHGYVGSKLRRDPVHREVLRLAAAEGFGDVVDIGCGRGQLGIALLEAGAARSVIGLDCQAAQLGQCEQAASGLAFQSRLLDLADKFEIPAADTLLAVDVLYQLDDASQQRLLDAMARCAGQRVVLRLLDPACGLRSVLTLGLERLWRRVSPHSGRWVNPWPVTRIASVFRAAGYHVAVAPCWRGTPFANVLLIARRRPP